MKSALFPALLLGLLAVGSCTAGNDPEPAAPTAADQDVLMKAHGFWEWESSATLGNRLTPITVGFTRQLIFKRDSLVHIYHNQQLFARPGYGLSRGVLSRCGQPQLAVPLVRYVAEPQIPNNDLRTYLIRISPTDTTLSIIGEAACVDGGYFERYRWHRR